MSLRSSSPTHVRSIILILLLLFPIANSSASEDDDEMMSSIDANSEIEISQVRQSPEDSIEPDSDNSKRKRIFTTRQERLDAGTRYELLPDFHVFGLVEYEYLQDRLRFTDALPKKDETTSESAFTAEMGFEWEPSSWVMLESNFEYDNLMDQVYMDEIIVKFIAGDFELELGDLYLPFGEYYSHFLIGPMLEFTELRALAAVLTYEIEEIADISAYLYQDTIKMTHTDRLDWGLAAEIPLPGLTIGAGYLSNLANADDGEFEDHNTAYEERVDGMALYASLDYEKMTFTTEFTSALSTFDKYDKEWDRPRAWNMELSHYPSEYFSWAMRLEGSRELEDEPQWKSGISAAWYISKQITLRAELLYGRFRSTNIEEDDEEEEPSPDDLIQFGTGLVIVF